MKSKMKKLSGTSRRIEVNMPKETVDRVFSEVLEDIRKQAVIPGFRAGKAPADLVMKKHSKQVNDEVKQRLIPFGYQQALREKEVRPVSYPEISDILMSPEGSLSFNATFDVHPDVSVRKYKGIKVTRKKARVDEKEVDEAIERIRNMYAEFEDKETPVKKGDFAVCDVETYMNGGSIAKKRENMWIEADKEASLLGMGEELVGMKKGDVKNIDVTLPENYPDKKYAGKDAVFEVEIKEVKIKKVPPLDENLARKMGKDSVEEFRAGIRDQLLERKRMNSNVEAKNQIMEYLLARNRFDVPRSMVERQLKVLMDKAENELLSKGVQKEAVEAHKDKLREQLEKEAENKVRLYFICDNIARNEDITVTSEEIDNWIRNLAASYNQEFEKVKRYYTENDLIGGLEEQLREDKTLELLLSEASVTEK
jgi:trigger factor